MLLTCSPSVMLLTPSHHIRQGIRRIFSELDDLKLDIPLVHVYLDHFIHRAVHLRFVNPDLLKEVSTFTAGMALNSLDFY